MGSFKTSLKTFCSVTRPMACLTTLVGTWAATVLFSQQLFTTQNIAATVAMTIFCLASSLYYSAMAYKPQPARHGRVVMRKEKLVLLREKSEVRREKRTYIPLINGPVFPEWRKPLLVIASILVLIATIVIARYLPLSIFLAVIYAAYAVYKYTKLDGSEPFWLKRSICGACIAALCVLFAGTAVGADSSLTTPDVNVLTGVVFFLYLLKEILKHMNIAIQFPALKRFPINVGEKKTSAYLGIQGVWGMIAITCIMPLALIMLPINSWKLMASPNLIIGQFIVTVIMVCLAWFVAIIVIGIGASFDDKPKSFNPLHGLHHLVTTCTWLMAMQAVVRVM